MRPDPPKKPDVLTLLARAASRRRRRSLVPLLLLTAAGVLLVGLLLFWIFSGSEPRELALVAFDGATRPGEPVTLRAGLQSLDAGEEPARLGGFDVYFVEPATGLQTKAATARDGLASVEHRFAADGLQPVKFTVRCPREGRTGLEAVGRTFVWPAEARLLVVDADHALAADPAALVSADNLDVAPRPGAVAALRGTAGRFRVVYLSAEAETPLAYLKRAAWLRQGWRGPQDQFPDGPLLGRASRPDVGDATAFRQAAVARLQELFREGGIAIAGRAEEARVFHAAGWKTYVVGEAEGLPEDVTVVPTWEELARRLAP